MAIFFVVDGCEASINLRWALLRMKKGLEEGVQLGSLKNGYKTTFHAIRQKNVKNPNPIDKQEAED